MRSLFKKTAISIVVLGLTSSAFAHQQQMMGMSGVKGYFVGIEGLYAQPRNGDLDYATLYPLTSSPDATVDTKAISTDYDWGFRVFGGVKFGDHDDATLSWQRIHTSDSNSVDTSTGFRETTPRWLDDDWDSISGKVDFDLDNVTLVMGHSIHFNNPWSMRFAGGLEYARIDSDMTVSALDGSDYFAERANSKLDAVGPRLEFDARYQLTNEFSLFMNNSAAMLIGDRSVSLSPTNPEGNDFFAAARFSDRHVVVPKLGMRLGVNYAYMFGNSGGEGACGSVLNIDAGWEANMFIHAIERPDPGTYYGNEDDEIVAFQGNSAFQDTNDFAGTKTSNFAVQGFFLGVNYAWM